MKDRSLKVLEFYHLLEILKSFSTSPLGRKRCEELQPCSDLRRLQSRLAEVMELKAVVEGFGALPIQGLKDIEETLKKLEIEGAVLEVPDLIDIGRQIALVRGLKRFFQKIDAAGAAFPLLQEKILNLSLHKDLEKQILSSLSPEGEILDGASPGLGEIRNRVRLAKEKAKGALEHLFGREELQSIFQEQLITLRNGRYVVLIKADSKHRLEGIVHGQSQSRMTFFFEPLHVVELNNEIHLLMGEEKEEEYRILADLSKEAKEKLPSLWEDLRILGDLDLLHAMARLSVSLKSVQPDLNEEGVIDLQEARNPLLVFQKGEDQIVPVDLRLGDGKKVLILSGANAGGKTVALKTLGLLTLMVQSGLPIPAAEGSRISLFREIFAVIGDEQNIEEDLSTFSGHLLHVNEVLEQTGRSSLVLIDELGVGTDAREGCALAMAFLDRFREKGASIVVTTHFDRLKSYGYLHSDVENVAVQFDEETLEPKYTLRYGASGLSNAFLVAEKLGISREILERARHYQDGGGEESARALAELERLKADADRERQGLLEMRKETEMQRRRLGELVNEIKARRHEILARAEEKARKAALQAEEEFKAWVRERKEEKAARLTARPIGADRRELREIRERLLPTAAAREGGTAARTGFKPGDRVKIESLRSTGTLLKVEEDLERVEVTTEKGKVKTSFSDILKIGQEDGAREADREDFTKRGAGEIPSQLNVIGLTVEDALPVVDKFIDQALFHGLEKVYIIHGMGSGRLRSAIGKYLQGHRGVRRSSLGDAAKGGSGVTVVEL